MSNLQLLSFHDWLVDLRRELHQIPEPGYKEEKTAAKICRVLDELGIPYQTGVGKTGVVARVKSQKEGPVVAFRADMDALPLEESNDVPYKSLHPGFMHACGHDVHITSLVGTARQMVARKDDWSGTLMLVVQPAEERISGARRMLEDGLYERFPKPDYALAFHVSSQNVAGQVNISEGSPFAGADTVDIIINGVGAHGAHSF